MTETNGVTIAPWLTVPNGAEAVAFYRNAFGAVELYRLDGEDGGVAVAQLDVAGAAFWVQEDGGKAPAPDGGTAVRMIVSVDQPDAWFDRAVGAGAAVVAEVHQAYGWRTGRVLDPFGHHWEFSRQL